MRIAKRYKNWLAIVSDCAEKAVRYITFESSLPQSGKSQATRRRAQDLKPISVHYNGLTHLRKKVEEVSRKEIKLSIFERAFSRTKNLAGKYRFPLSVFFVALVIRSIPEIVVGANPIGFDTISYYVPQTLDIAGGRMNVIQVIGTAPLIYLISVPAYILAGLNPILIFKILGPLFYGFFVVVLYRFLRVGLQWQQRNSLFGALFACLYFVTLRIGWDLLRTTLGMSFILLSLEFFGIPVTKRNGFMLAILTLLAVASDQVTGVLELATIAAIIAIEARRKSFLRVKRLVLTALPGAILLLLIIFGQQVGSIVQVQPATPSGAAVVGIFGFLIYLYAPLTPFLFFGIRKVTNRPLQIWTALSIAIVASRLFPYYGPIQISNRWSLLLDIPVCIYGAAGLVRAFRTHWHLPFSPRILFSAVLILMLASATLYISLPAESAFSYYTEYPSFVPSSMIQSSIPLSQMANLRTLLSWVALNMGPDTILITHQAIYGWARTYVRSENIVNYGFASPLEGLNQARTAGYKSVLMIWWNNGSGWYGQQTVPNGFIQTVTAGDLALFAH